MVSAEVPHLMTTPTPKKADLQWIQALRGIAALMVLFFHMHPHWDLTPILAATSVVTKWGFSGVDIFFALSGFVVYRSAQRVIPSQGIWPFAKKRLLRIYLGYWPVLLLLALTTVFVYHNGLPPVKQIAFSSLLLYPNIWDNWLQPAWSLTMEIYFYLWIALIALLPQQRQIKAIALMMAALATWGVGWLFIDPAGVFNGHQPLRYGLTGLGLEFLAGAILGHVYDHNSRLFHTPKRAIPLYAALLVSGLLLGTTSPYFDRVEVMRAASFGVMGLSALALALTLERTDFAPPIWLVTIGNASYSLYLLHTILLDAGGRIRFSLGIDSPSALLIFLLALPVAIILLSLLWYHCVEKPIMKIAL